ncbi:hypothetical protein BGX38DRAFT_477840 [Terfezia claveryi]|nr:hypothetical protein BGX38DRAFT_477840 [Terfezia claveryi]
MSSNMLRLFRQPAVRLAIHRIPRRIQFRGFINGSENEEDLFIPGGKQEEEAGQKWAPNNYDRMWDRVDKLDDRVAGLTNDLGGFKGDVNKSLGELATRMEAGFRRMETSMEKNYGELKTSIEKNYGELKTSQARLETSMEKNYGELKADIKPLVWQVRILLGGASLVIVFLVKTYLDEHNIFNKKLADAMPQPVSGPAVVAHKIDPKK